VNESLSCRAKAQASKSKHIKNFEVLQRHHFNAAKQSLNLSAISGKVHTRKVGIEMLDSMLVITFIFHLESLPCNTSIFKLGNPVQYFGLHCGLDIFLGL